MKIGNLNRRVEVLAFFKTKDEYGGEDGEWVVGERLASESRDGRPYRPHQGRRRQVRPKQPTVVMLGVPLTQVSSRR